MLVGHEVSPKAGHLLVFGLDEEIPHKGRTEREICTAVLEAGGVAFAAHPFSEGSRMSKLIAPPHGWKLLDDAVCGGIELWSLTSDAAEAWRTPREAVAFLRDPMRTLSGPPARHLEIWDRLCLRRRVPAIGGLDAHQRGIRIRGRVRSPMPNARYFAMLQTHVLLPSAPAGELAADRAAVYEALGEGRCYLSFEALAPGRGFRFWAEGDAGAAPMGARVEPGRVDHEGRGATARAPATAARRSAGARGRGRPARASHRRGRRLSASRRGLLDDERGRLWLVSNPVYVRAA